MRLWIVLAGAGLVLWGCSKPGEAKFQSYSDPAPQTASLKPPPPAAEAKAVQPVSPAPGGLLLAYSYDETISVPTKGLPGLIAKHQSACSTAGAPQCQIVTSELSRSAGYAAGKLEIRATPAWLATFRRQLDRDAKEAGGGVQDSKVTSEDLTSQITDTNALLKAKTTLRDRLLAILATRPGKVSDLLDVERELAKVQGEIDAGQSELALMRQRVDTSLLTIAYMSSDPAASSATGSNPIVEALRHAGEQSAIAVAFVITAAATLWPVLLVGLAIFWAFSAWRRRAKAAAAKRKAQV